MSFFLLNVFFFFEEMLDMFFSWENENQENSERTMRIFKCTFVWNRHTRMKT
jgi:hypothetical protein